MRASAALHLTRSGQRLATVSQIRTGNNRVRDAVVRLCEQVAEPANAIVGLADEWVDVTAREPELGYHTSAQCADICFLADQCRQGTEFRILMKRPADS